MFRVLGEASKIFINMLICMIIFMEISEGGGGGKKLKVQRGNGSMKIVCLGEGGKIFLGYFPLFTLPPPPG